MSKASSEPTKEEIKEKVRSELKLVFSNFYKGSAKEAAYARSSAIFAQRAIKTGKISLLLADIPVVMQMARDNLAKISEPNDESWLKLRATRRVLVCLGAFSYMAFVEAMATPYIDLSILLLSTEGDFFHVGPDRKHNYVRHAMSLSDLDSPSVSMANKLDYLESCGLPFFSKWVDRDLRNTIAHMNFDIDDNGDFLKTTKGRQAKESKVPIDLQERLQSFNNYYIAVSDIFIYEMEKLHRSKSQ